MSPGAGIREGGVSERSEERGEAMPLLRTAVPGPASVALVDRLASTECPAITSRRARRASETGVPQDPLVWDRARGANVWDVDGNRYVDLTAAFAVAGLGHGHPRVVEAAERQASRLIHAMGDVYPSEAKIDCCERLAAMAPGDLSMSILGMSGSDAVEAALKTATVATGRPGVMAFWGGYHGLSYGALSVTAYRRQFRAPFRPQLNPHTRHVPYPDTYRPPLGGESDEEVGRRCLEHVRAQLEHPASGGELFGAVIVEPIQGRGGEVVPPPGFLQGLRELCDEHGLVLIFDEIYTGFGRTGRMFACEHEGVVPDIMCVGKAMGGGFPLSAAVGRPEVMRAWGASAGEAIHTSTFLGNPLGCAMASAAMDTLVEENWPEKVAEAGGWLREQLEALQRRFPARIGRVRGRGLMLGLDLVKDPVGRDPDGATAMLLTDAMRQRGYLVLPSGVWGNVLALSPPFVITRPQLQGALEALEEAMTSIEAGS